MFEETDTENIFFHENLITCARSISTHLNNMVSITPLITTRQDVIYAICYFVAKVGQP
jgi:hypothetical protein